MSSSDAESDGIASISGSPPPVPLEDKLRQVFKSTWDDFYAWSPPRTLPLRTTVPSEIAAAQYAQAVTLKEVVAQAQLAKASGSKGKGKEKESGTPRRNGYEALAQLTKRNTSISTTWVRYGAIPRAEQRENTRSESVMTEATSVSHPTSVSTTMSHQGHTVTKPGVSNRPWVCSNNRKTGPVVPVPAYTFCQYTNINTVNPATGRQQFKPTLDDDIEFDQDEYSSLFELAPEWLELDRDPDVDIILAETLVRMQEQLKHGPDSTQKYNMTAPKIDGTRVLPQVHYDIVTRELGRTLPAFPDKPNSGEILNPDLRTWKARPEVADIELAEESSWRDWMDLACPSDSCVAVNCPVHVREGKDAHMGVRTGLVRSLPLPASRRPRPSTSCSGDCFVDLPVSLQPLFTDDAWRIEARDGFDWSSADRRRLATLLVRQPGDPLQDAITPCDLRVLFPDKTCSSVARQIFTIAKSRIQPLKRSKPKAVKAPVFQTDANQLEAIHRCQHSGPCEEGCRCFETRTFCERQCLCDDNCPRRFKGCSCRRSDLRAPCEADKCECIKAQRECDPGVCLECGAAEVTQRRTVSAGTLSAKGEWTPRNQAVIGIKGLRRQCQNVHLQSSRRAKVRVDLSTVAGYGLFADENIEKGDIIDEYVGDLISNREADRRDMIYKVTDRNYLFDVVHDQLIDAAHTGNLVRFINHQHPGANCSVKISQVLGDHRIRIYANRRLLRHQELFINYGDMFMRKDSTQSKPKPTVKPKVKATTVTLPRLLRPVLKPSAVSSIRPATSLGHIERRTRFTSSAFDAAASRASAAPPTTRTLSNSRKSTSNDAIVDGFQPLQGYALKAKMALFGGRQGGRQGGLSSGSGPLSLDEPPQAGWSNPFPCDIRIETNMLHQRQDDTTSFSKASRCPHCEDLDLACSHRPERNQRRATSVIRDGEPAAKRARRSPNLEAKASTPAVAEFLAAASGAMRSGMTSR